MRASWTRFRQPESRRAGGWVAAALSDPQLRRPRRLPVDAIELLESQHEEVKALFNQCDETSGEARRQVFEQIADALAVHSAIEEKHFYPSTRAARSDESLQEAVAEHFAMKRLVADLLELDPAEAQFDVKLQELRDQVETHVQEEEGDFFPRARRLLSDDQLLDVAVMMEDMIDELNANGAPRDLVTGEGAPLH
jgi:hypothetical protein